MTLDPSAVTKALENITVYGYYGRDDEDVDTVVAAARSWVEGEEGVWCAKHCLPRAEGIEDVCVIGYMPLFDPDEDLPCEFVSKRLCDGVDGGDR